MVDLLGFQGRTRVNEKYCTNKHYWIIVQLKCRRRIATEVGTGVAYMHHKLMTFLLLAVLAGCAQPQLEQPKANGAYLVIEGGAAWAVLVRDGKRIEEAGRVLDVVKLPGQESSIAASYVIETPNCGRLQWLTERGGEGEVTRLAHGAGEALERPGCSIASDLSRAWTALDYSG